MKKIFLFLSSLAFFSCSSLRFSVLGESASKKSNIFAEYMNIADAYSDLGKYDKAINYYTLAMSNKNLRWTSKYKLAYSYAMNKNWEQAEKIYYELYRRDRENLSIKMSLAYVYAMNGKISSANVIYSSLYEKNPENADILVNYINILIAMENYTEAQDKLNILKEKFSDNSNISTFEKKLEELTNKTEELKDSELPENSSSEKQ